MSNNTINSSRWVNNIRCLYNNLYICLLIYHHNRYQGHVQVLTTTTKLLTCPNKTWAQPCQVDFELDDPTALPTVDNERLGVKHFIRISIEFCNSAGESDCCNKDLQFPIVFTGCLLNNERKKVVFVGKSATTSTTVTKRRRATSSISSCSSFGEVSSCDSAFDIPPYESICNYLNTYKLKA
jgi:hypothetical protein